jgi:hypothetical protein
LVVSLCFFLPLPLPPPPPPPPHVPGSSVSRATWTRQRSKWSASRSSGCTVRDRALLRRGYAEFSSIVVLFIYCFGLFVSVFLCNIFVCVFAFCYLLYVLCILFVFVLTRWNAFS